jgi:copper transporter 1
MFFQWSTTVTILFEWWVTTTWYFYLLSCVAVFVLANGLEGVRVGVHMVSHGHFIRKTPLRRAGESLLYGAYVGLSYCVMLVIMTYNVGIIVSVLLGYCVGHFLFFKVSQREQAEQPGQPEDTKLIVAVNDDEDFTRVCH